MLSRQLEEFGLPLVAGGLADQPMGYLADVMRVRSYARAKEAMERETGGGMGEDGPRFPAPQWATDMVMPVLMRVEAQRQGVDLDAEDEDA